MRTYLPHLHTKLMSSFKQPEDNFVCSVVQYGKKAESNDLPVRVTYWAASVQASDALTAKSRLHSSNRMFCAVSDST